MSIAELVDFPADRALHGTGAGWDVVEIDPLPLSPHLTESPVRAIALGVLTVFGRLTDQPVLQVRICGKESQNENLYVVGGTARDVSLSAALTALQVEAEPEEAAEVNLVLEAAPGLEAPGDATPRLRFRIGAAGLHLSLRHDRSRISPVTARDFLEKIGVVLTALGERPEGAVGDLELIGDTARGLLPDLARRIEVQPHRTVAGMFFDVAARHPDAPAITNGPHSYSYEALSATVRVVAGQLLAAGLKPGEVVAVSGVSSFGTLAGMLAVLTAGGVLVTLDRSLPEARQALIRQVAEPRLVVEVGPARDGASATALRITDWPGRDAVARMVAEAPATEAVLVPPKPDAAAYIFFTSGTTGLPKGVLGSHIGLAHFLAWQRENFPIGPGDRASQLTALSFDVVLRDVLFPLTSGACLHIPSREQVLDARRMLTWIETNQITVMHAVPSLMKAWLQAHVRGTPFASLRTIFFAGEPLTDGLLRQLRGVACEETVFVNLYGPTETTLAKLSHRIDRIEPGVQPVGRPQPGTDVVILRDRRVPCGLWEVGEIAIRTPYRSKGYFRNPDLTDSVFLRNPWTDDPEDRLYMTGDLGRVRADGRVEIFGRSDSQIKIRGVRIEPIEIEGLLLQQAGVKDAAITTRPGVNDGKVLLALVVPREPVAEADRPAMAQRLREALMAELHPAMVPARVIFAESLPYLPNGKCDRKAIAALDLNEPEAESVDPAGMDRFSPEQRALVAALGGVLNSRIDDLDKSFIDMGGDSLSYVQASMLVEDHLGHLPEQWERQPFRALLCQSGAERGKPGFWTGIDATLLLRAIAIFFVCLSHTPTGTAVIATSTLFVVSGMNFARFLRPATQKVGDISGTTSLILKILIPAGLWQAMREVAAGDFWLPDLILMGTFFQDPANPHFTFWFLDVLAANLVILCLIALAGYALRPPALRGTVPKPSLRTDILWLIIGVEIAILQVQTGMGDGIVGTDSVAPFKWFWMLAFGVAIATATQTRQKLVMTGLLALLGVAQHSGVALFEKTFFNVDLFFFCAVGFLIWVDRIPVPRSLQKPIVTIASSTLFIYIVNYTVITNILPKLRAPDWWMLQVAAAIVVGIMVKRAWDTVNWTAFQRILPALKRGDLSLLSRRRDDDRMRQMPAE